MFRNLEESLNKILLTRTKEINENAELNGKFNLLFKQEENHSRGMGEKPSWEPNQAYMQSLEWIWSGCETNLTKSNLAIIKSLTELFKESREFKDSGCQHRRIFYGQLMNMDNNIPVTAFMLSAPHSHDKFLYPAPIQIHISYPLHETAFKAS